MIATFLSLLERTDVSLRKPAPVKLIQRVFKEFNAALPDPLMSFWQRSDGLDMKSFHGHFLGPSELCTWLDAGGPIDDFIQLGFVPLLDDHESNYLMMTVKPPLAYRIAYVPHDDGSQLLYRDLETMSKALSEALENDETADYFHETPGDYRSVGSCTQDDHEAARELLRTNGENGEWNFACQLLDETNIAEWSTLLETDHFIRRDATRYLKQMTSPAIRKLLKRDQNEFEEFATALAKAVQAADFLVGKRSGTALQVGSKWIEIEGFFYRRNARDAMNRIVNWIKDLQAGRNPHDRPDHVFVT